MKKIKTQTLKKEGDVNPVKKTLFPFKQNGYIPKELTYLAG